MGQISVNQFAQIGGDGLGPHDKRIAAGQNDIRHLGMDLQILHKLFRLLHGKTQLFHPDKLGPAETESAIGMTGLALTGKAEHRFLIFMLHPCQHLAVQ